MIATRLIHAVTTIAGLGFRAAGPLASYPLRLARLARLRAYTRGEVPLTTQFDGPVRTAGTIQLRMGEHCRLGRNVFLETVNAGRIQIGCRVRINAGCSLVSYAAITIGNDCLLGEYTSIRDADHGTDPGRPIREQPHVAAPVTIGRDVWIGRGVAVLKGVTIGDGAVIGANSVVTHDVPPGEIWAGVPARFLRKRLPPAAANTIGRSDSEC